MTIEYIQHAVIPAAFAMLPPHMDCNEANAMLLAIGLQESGFDDRRQINGPALGFWQFESNGVNGVLIHPSTKEIANGILRDFGYRSWTAYDAIEDNDILACVFARLLLWTHAGDLPKRDEPQQGWNQYVDLWRPGKPRRETWDAHFASAWEIVQA